MSYSLKTIIVYPNIYQSPFTKDYHKGEYIPKYKAVLFSWEDILKGFENSTDNINLAVHEFSHVLHMHSKSSNDISSILFYDSFKELSRLIHSNSDLKERLLSLSYFRDYAYSNEYEFLAVLIENFIETPNKLKKEYPRIYKLTKQMLNFNYAGY